MAGHRIDGFDLRKRAPHGMMIWFAVSAADQPLRMPFQARRMDIG